MKKLRFLAIHLLILPLVFIACNRDEPKPKGETPTGFIVSGTLFDNFLSIDSVSAGIYGLRANKNDPGYISFGSSKLTHNQFTISFTDIVNDANLMYADQMYDGITASDKTAKISDNVSLLGYKNGEYMSEVKYGDKGCESEFGRSCSESYIYANKDFTMTGTHLLESDTELVIMNYNVNFKAGWNKIYSGYSNSGNAITLNVVNSVRNDLVWFITKSNNTDLNRVATITFDKTSTPQVLEDGSLIIIGSVISKEGTTIESIEAICAYTISGGQTAYTEIGNISAFTKVADNHYSFVFTQTTKGIIEHINDIKGVKITASVKNGDISKKIFAVEPYHISPETNLDAETAFQWVRVSGTAATGLDIFGLAWTENTSTTANIKKNSAVKFVNLGASAWTTITTKGALASAIDAASDMTEYRNISVTADKTYDEVLGLRNGDVDYMLHITKGTIKSEYSGIIVTIEGAYKR